MDTPANAEVIVTGLSNQEFLDKYARAGCIGLAGGATLIDWAIRRAERHIDDDAKWSLWSHSFVFQGVRADGRHWVFESDLEVHRKHIRLGVQENRVEKYYDEKHQRNLAVLDFGLTEAQLALVLREALDLVHDREQYSLREIFGVLKGLRHEETRDRENPLARKRSLFCSAFVRHLYSRAGVDLTPGIADKHTTPEDIFRTSLPHTRYVLRRDEPKPKVGLRARLRQRVKGRIDEIKAKRRKAN